MSAHFSPASLLLETRKRGRHGGFSPSSKAQSHPDLEKAWGTAAPLHPSAGGGCRRSSPRCSPPASHTRVPNIRLRQGLCHVAPSAGHWELSPGNTAPCLFPFAPCPPPAECREWWLKSLPSPGLSPTNFPLLPSWPKAVQGKAGCCAPTEAAEFLPPSPPQLLQINSEVCKQGCPPAQKNREGSHHGRMPPSLPTSWLVGRGGGGHSPRAWSLPGLSTAAFQQMPFAPWEPFLFPDGKRPGYQARSGLTWWQEWPREQPSKGPLAGEFSCEAL